jgi:hypothetical protein
MSKSGKLRLRWKGTISGMEKIGRDAPGLLLPNETYLKDTYVMHNEIN